VLLEEDGGKEGMRSPSVFGSVAMSGTFWRILGE
jgi:hypothetical protein